MSTATTRSALNSSNLGAVLGLPDADRIGLDCLRWPLITALSQVRGTLRYIDAMSAGDASTVEQRALRTSIWVSISFAVISVVWGLLARSEVILLTAVFTPLELLLTSGSLIVSRIVAKGPSRMFPSAGMRSRHSS